MICTGRHSTRHSTPRVPPTPRVPQPPPQNPPPNPHQKRTVARMRISDKPIANRLAALGVEIRPGVALADHTSLGIGGTTDQLLIRNYDTLPEVMRELRNEGIPHKFLGGGTNVLIDDGELNSVVLHLPS